MTGCPTAPTRGSPPCGGLGGPFYGRQTTTLAGQGRALVDVARGWATWEIIFWSLLNSTNFRSGDSIIWGRKIIWSGIICSEMIWYEKPCRASSLDKIGAKKLMPEFASELKRSGPYSFYLYRLICRLWNTSQMLVPCNVEKFIIILFSLIFLLVLFDFVGINWNSG